MKRTELRRKTPWRPKVKPREPSGGVAQRESEGLSIPVMRVRVPSPPTPKPKAKPKTTKARQAARGRPCLIRLPGCAPGPDNETVVLCHYSLAGISGGSLKSPDNIAAFGCHHCHGVVDGRLPLPHGYTRAEVRLAHAEGVFRTQLYERLALPITQ